jgi:hypothetical protein
MVLAVLLAWCLLRLSRPAVPPAPTFPPDAGTFTFAPEPNPRERAGSGVEAALAPTSADAAVPISVDAAAPTSADVAAPAPTFAAVALWVTACLALAYSLAAPYSLPWYDLLVWCALPAVLPGLVDLVALVRLVALAVAYVPGRVLGMTPAVEHLTLGVRRGVIPWVGLLLWVVVIGAGARRGSGPLLGPRRAGTTPTPTR